MKEGKLPDTNLKVLPAKEEQDADLEGLDLPSALRKLLPMGFKVRHTHRHKFECGGEEKIIATLILSQD